MGEVFVQHEYDEFRRLQLRALVGAGPVLDIYDHDDLRLQLGTAYMLEYERLNDDGQPDDGATDLQHRVSGFLTGNYALDDRVEVTETFYAQPRLTDAADIRLLNDLAITVKLTDAVSMTTALNIAWDNAPPAGVEELDTALKSSLTVGF